MIAISKGAAVAGLPDLIVSSPSGEYADTDLLLCAYTSDPNFDVAMYQAQFIRYGEVVYQHETPEALGEALLALDSESTHDAAQLWREELERRRAREGGTLVPENPTPAPDAVEPDTRIPEEEEDDVKFFREQEEQKQAAALQEVQDQAASEWEMPVIDAVEPTIGEVGGVSTSTIPTQDPTMSVIQMEEPLPAPSIPDDTMASTTPQ